MVSATARRSGAATRANLKTRPGVTDTRASAASAPGAPDARWPGGPSDAARASATRQVARRQCQTHYYKEGLNMSHSQLPFGQIAPQLKYAHRYNKALANRFQVSNQVVGTTTLAGKYSCIPGIIATLAATAANKRLSSKDTPAAFAENPQRQRMSWGRQPLREIVSLVRTAPKRLFLPSTGRWRWGLGAICLHESLDQLRPT